MLKIKLWNFVEDTLGNDELSEKYLNLKKSVIEIDKNQNKIMDINFGLSDYRRVSYMLRIAKLLKYKQKQELLLAKTEDNYQHLKYLREIKRIGNLAKKKLDNLKLYAAQHKPQAMVAYV